MNPLDWNGPEFLNLYVPLLVAGFIVALLVRGRLRLPGGDPQHQGPRLDLDPYEVARLKGDDAPVDAAVAALLHRGALRVDGNTLRLGKLPKDATPFERAVHAAAAKQTSLWSVRRKVRKSLERLEEGLAHKGLVMGGKYAFLVRVIPALLHSLVLALGIAKLCVGISRNRPVGLLFLLLLCGLFGLVVLLRKPRLSRLGEATLKALQERHQPLRATVSSEGVQKAVSNRDVALAVGLFGTSVLNMSGFLSLRRFLAGGGVTPSTSSSDTYASTFNTSSCSGSSSCSSSSSCSGGSSGCGGCGGGGGD